MFKKDLYFGIKKEIELLPILKNHFKDDSIFQLTQYDIFDYKGNNKFIELKSRNCNYDKYPKTMIGYNKIKKASSILEDVYFFFWFTDGIFYYKYNKDDKFEIKQSGRYDRVRSGELNDYAFIPIQILKEII